MLPLTVVPALLLGAAVKGAVLVVAVAAVILLFRVRSATSRHAFWTAVVVGHLAIPAIVSLAPGWHVPIPHAFARLFSSLDRRTVDVEDVPMPSGDITAMAYAQGEAHARPRGFARRHRPGTGSYGGGGTRVTVTTPRPGRIAPRIIISTGQGMEVATIAYAEAPPRDRAGFWPLRFGAWLAPTIFVLWLVGALAVLVRLALGTTRVAMLAREATRVVDGEWLSVLHWLAREVGITRPLTLMRGNELVVPVTWGVVYPKILLPVDADEWTAERRRHVLLHELAHVRRFDALTQLLAQFALALFWFDPLLWYAVHRMRVERERACDDLVIRHGALPSRYAGDLLELVQTIGVTRGESMPAFATLAMARRHDFEGRMLSILDPDPDRRPFTRGRALGIAAVALLLVVPLAAMRPYESGQPMGWADVSVPAFAPTAIGVGGGVSGGVLVELPTLPPMPAEPAPYLMELPEAPVPVTPAADEVPAAAAMPMLAAGEECEAMYDGSGSQTSLHSNSDDEEVQKLRYLSRDRRRCVLATLEGKAEFSDDDGDIVWLSRGGRATFEEHVRDGVWRRLTISERGGGLERAYTENGEAAPFGTEARAWMHSMVQEIIRETAYRAEARVARLRRDDGVQAVLNEIARIRSTGAKRAYFSALLDGERLSERDLEATVRQAGRELESSGDLSAVLTKVPVSSARAGTRDALADAVAHVESDGDKARVITTLVQGSGDDREFLLVALRAAATIESDGDASRVLTLIAPLALAKGDDSLRAEFFRAARTIESDGDERRVLSTAIREARATPDLTLDLIRTARRIESDGDKAAVLSQIATAGLLDGKELTQEFLDAARTIESDGDYRRVMEAMKLRTGR